MQNLSHRVQKLCTFKCPRQQWSELKDSTAEILTVHNFELSSRWHFPVGYWQLLQWQQQHLFSELLNDVHDIGLRKMIILFLAANHLSLVSLFTLESEDVGIHYYYTYILYTPWLHISPDILTCHSIFWLISYIFFYCSKSSCSHWLFLVLPV